MKLRFLLALLLISVAAPAQDTVTLIANHVTMGAGGKLVPDGSQLCAMTTDQSDRPAGYRIGAGAGQTSASTDYQDCSPIASGALTTPLTVINSANSAQQNACIRITLFDPDGREMRRDKCVQTGTALSLSNGFCSVSGSTEICDWNKYPPQTVPNAIGGNSGSGPPGAAASVAVGTVTTVDDTALAAVTNAGTSQSAILNFQLPRGHTGDTGPKGDTGAQGPVGASGPKGDTGAQGPQGADGAQGPKGDAGAQGPTGATGLQGPGTAVATSLSGLQATTAPSTPGASLFFGQKNALDVKPKQYFWQPGGTAVPDDDTTIQGTGGQWTSYPELPAGYGLRGHLPSSGSFYYMGGFDSLCAGAGAPTSSGCLELLPMLRAQIGDGGQRYTGFDDLISASFGTGFSNGGGTKKISTLQPSSIVNGAANVNNPWIYSLEGFGIYTADVNLTFSGGGCTTQPTGFGFVNSSGVVDFVRYATVGTGCTSAPTVTVTPSDGVVTTSATLTATVSGGSGYSLTITNGGAGYSTSSSSYKDGVRTVALTGGSSYTSASVTFSGGGCTTQPTANLTVSGGAVSNVTFTGLGAGCTSAPTGTVSGDGSGAAVTVTLGAYGTVSWQPRSAYTTAVVYYQQKPTGGVLRMWNVSNPGTVYTVNTAGPFQLASFPVPADSANSGLSFQLEPDVWLFGADWQNANAKGASYTQIARGGQQMGQIAQFNATAQQQWYAALKPDALIFESSMNDRLTVNAALLQSWDQAYINNVKAGSPTTSGLIIRSNDASDATSGSSNQSSYGPMMQALAAANKWGYLSVRDLFGSFRNAVRLGLMAANTNGSGATASCNFDATLHTCTSYNVLTAGSNYVVAPGIGFFSTYHINHCPISPTVSITVSGGAVTSITPVSPGYCVVQPDVVIGGGGACTLDGSGNPQNCDGIHRSSGLNQSMAGGSTIVACAIARWWGFGCSGKDPGFTPLPSAGSGTAYPVSGTLTAKNFGATSGVAQQVYDLSVQRGLGRNVLFSITVSGNRSGTNAFTKRAFTFWLSSNGTAINQTNDCTTTAWKADVQTSLEYISLANDAQPQDFTLSTSYNSNRCQILITPTGFSQNLTVTGSWQSGYYDSTAQVVTEN